MIGMTKSEHRVDKTTMKIKHIICLAGALVFLFLAGHAAADDATDESGLFTFVAPDAMIVLDLSGSMKWNPPGEHDT